MDEAERNKLGGEILRRRTFAIISHPDAGKTTLTEKLLLHGGAIHLAGTVKARGQARHVTSDWMELERQRGISITSSVLQFDWAGHKLNLLDTPGHQDFSEDTYRTLAAADAAVMLIDSAKGVEAQTKKLFQVCRRRGIPIFTSVNKLDRPGREPIDLLHEVEEVLGIRTVPVTWPVGQGADFSGVATLFAEVGPHALRIVPELPRSSRSCAPTSPTKSSWWRTQGIPSTTRASCAASSRRPSSARPGRRWAWTSSSPPS